LLSAAETDNNDNNNVRDRKKIKENSGKVKGDEKVLLYWLSKREAKWKSIAASTNEEVEEKEEEKSTPPKSSSSRKASLSARKASQQPHGKSLPKRAKKARSLVKEPKEPVPYSRPMSAIS